MRRSVTTSAARRGVQRRRAGRAGWGFPWLPCRSFWSGLVDHLSDLLGDGEHGLRRVSRTAHQRCPSPPTASSSAIITVGPICGSRFGRRCVCGVLCFWQSACRSRSTFAFPRSALPPMCKGLAIFPMFVPSIILSYAPHPHHRPEWRRRYPAQRRRPAQAASRPISTPGGRSSASSGTICRLTVLMLTAGLGNIPKSSIEAARDVGARRLSASFSRSFMPRMGNSLLVTASFAVLGHILVLHAALYPRSRLAGDDGPLHAAHLLPT